MLFLNQIILFIQTNHFGYWNDRKHSEQHWNSSINWVTGNQGEELAPKFTCLANIFFFLHHLTFSLWHYLIELMQLLFLKETIHLGSVNSERSHLLELSAAKKNGFHLFFKFKKFIFSLFNCLSFHFLSKRGCSLVCYPDIESLLLTLLILILAI